MLAIDALCSVRDASLSGVLCSRILAWRKRKCVIYSHVAMTIECTQTSLDRRMRKARFEASATEAVNIKITTEYSGSVHLMNDIGTIFAVE